MRQSALILMSFLGWYGSLIDIDSHDPLNPLEDDEDDLEEDEEQLKADRLYADKFKGPNICPVSSVLDGRVGMHTEALPNSVLLRADASRPEPISDLAREAPTRSIHVGPRNRTYTKARLEAILRVLRTA